MNVWTDIAIANLLRRPPEPVCEKVEPSHGQCISCSDQLPRGRTKFCDDYCMREYHNARRNTTRHGRKAKQ